jgi:hypothetical protein
MRDEVKQKAEGRKQKAENGESSYCLLPCAFCHLFFHPLSLIPHPCSEGAKIWQSVR